MSGDQRQGQSFYLGRYNCVEQLGAGPAGEVFRGKVFGVAGFEKEFAIKRVRQPLLADSGFVARFVEAARAAAAECEGVGRVFEVVSQGPQVFVVSDMVRGLSLTHVIERAREDGGVDPVLACHFAAEMLRTLARAHAGVGPDRRAMLHLGLAPSNLFLTQDGRTAIVDFGHFAALHQGDWTPDESLRSRLGYLAPEVLAGRAVDGRADVFSMGAVVYQLCSMRAPFEAPTIERTVAAVTAASPPRLEVSESLWSAIVRLLDSDPTTRPDAAAAAEMLGRAVQAVGAPTRDDAVGLVRQLADPTRGIAAPALQGEPPKVDDEATEIDYNAARSIRNDNARKTRPLGSIGMHGAGPPPVLPKKPGAIPSGATPPAARPTSATVTGHPAEAAPEPRSPEAAAGRSRPAAREAAAPGAAAPGAAPGPPRRAASSVAGSEAPPARPPAAAAAPPPVPTARRGTAPKPRPSRAPAVSRGTQPLPVMPQPGAQPQSPTSNAGSGPTEISGMPPAARDASASVTQPSPAPPVPQPVAGSGSGPTEMTGMPPAAREAAAREAAARSFRARGGPPAVRPFSVPETAPVELGGVVPANRAVGVAFAGEPSLGPGSARQPLLSNTEQFDMLVASGRPLGGAVASPFGAPSAAGAAQPGGPSTPYLMPVQRGPSLQIDLAAAALRRPPALLWVILGAGIVLFAGLGIWIARVHTEASVVVLPPPAVTAPSMASDASAPTPEPPVEAKAPPAPAAPAKAGPAAKAPPPPEAPPAAPPEPPSAAKPKGPGSKGAEIQVVTRPAGARIFVDGKEQGRSPANLKVAPGTHRVALLRDGSRLWRGEVNAESSRTRLDETLPRASLADLRARGKASLRVQCPKKAAGRVLVDDVDTGLGCNTPRIHLTTGQHKVEVYFAAGDRTRTSQVKLEVKARSTYVRVKP
jgi:eukaryotic-like serine/threonine-protein kinase